VRDGLEDDDDESADSERIYGDYAEEPEDMTKTDSDEFIVDDEDRERYRLACAPTKTPARLYVATTLTGVEGT
jgi:hypothetical protein